MNIPNMCAVSGCDKRPLGAYSGYWVCGECMKKCDDISNTEMKVQMERMINGY